VKGEGCEGVVLSEGGGGREGEGGLQAINNWNLNQAGECRRPQKKTLRFLCSANYNSEGVL
jgi:hypothetical protein